MMNKVGETLTLIGVVVGAAAMLVVLAHVLLTLDELDSPALRAAYVAAVAVAITGVALFIRRRRRRRPAEERAGPPRVSAEARIDGLYARHRLDTGGGGQARRTRQRLLAGDPLTLAVAGLPQAGTRTLADALSAILPPVIHDCPLQITELPPLSVDFAANLDRMTAAIDADVVLFVVDQDLRDYEHAAVRALTERGVAPLVVLNRVDRMTAAAVGETRAALQQRLNGLLPEDDIIEAASDPLPAVRLVSHAGGAATEEEVPRPPQVAAVADRILSRLDRGRR
jgi:hypothetical protein